MGEKIKNLASLNIKGTKFDVELNKPVATTSQQQIHIQSGAIRMEFEMSDFLRIATGICFSAEQLKRLKNK